MKTEIEKKLEKLPDSIYIDCRNYYLIIHKQVKTWVIEYIDIVTENNILIVQHSSLQAAVDNTLKEIKKLQNEYRY